MFAEIIEWIKMGAVFYASFLLNVISTEEFEEKLDFETGRLLPRIISYLVTLKTINPDQQKVLQERLRDAISRMWDKGTPCPRGRLNKARETLDDDYESHLIEILEGQEIEDFDIEVRDAAGNKLGSDEEDNAERWDAVEEHFDNEWIPFLLWNMLHLKQNRPPAGALVIPMTYPTSEGDEARPAFPIEVDTASLSPAAAWAQREATFAGVND
jgi:hypothetical protein